MELAKLIWTYEIETHYAVHSRTPHGIDRPQIPQFSRMNLRTVPHPTIPPPLHRSHLSFTDSIPINLKMLPHMRIPILRHHGLNPSLFIFPANPTAQ